MRSRLLVCMLLLSVFAIPSLAQSPALLQPQQTQPPQRRGDSAPFGDEDDPRGRLAHDMEKKAAKDRVAALKTDAEKLLRLSNELKAYVDKSDENVLSLDVIKKAEEIEKLAKSVKDKMKGPN
jgi:type VI protein secretion system component VasF